MPAFRVVYLGLTIITDDRGMPIRSWGSESLLLIITCETRPRAQISQISCAWPSVLAIIQANPPSL